MDLKLDFKDVWTAATDVADELSGEGSIQLASNAFVLPRGVSSPGELTGWADQPHHIYQRLNWESEYFDTTPTRVRVGASWYFGGGVNGEGRAIANADIYFVIESIGYWEKFKVESQFNSPLAVGNSVAQLSGTIRISYFEYSTLSSSHRAEFQIRGDGSGNIWWA